MTKQKKYYAVHYINEKKDFIVSNWAECQKLTKGHNNMFKSFADEESARGWLEGITKQHESAHNRQVQKHKNVAKEKKHRVRYSFQVDEELAKAFNDKMQRLGLKPEVVFEDLLKDYLSWEE